MVLSFFSLFFPPFVFGMPLYCKDFHDLADISQGSFLLVLWNVMWLLVRCHTTLSNPRVRDLYLFSFHIFSCFHFSFIVFLPPAEFLYKCCSDVLGSLLYDLCSAKQLCGFGCPYLRSPNTVTAQ